MRILLHISLTLTFVVFAMCKKQESDTVSTELVLGLLILNNTQSPYDTVATSQEYMDRFDYALTQWNIALVTGIRGTSRSLSSFAEYSPKNWGVVTEDGCVGPGVPSSMQGSGCAFNTSGVIGVCQVRFYSNGEIADTTLLLRKSFQDDSNVSITEAIKRAVWIHEVGHCLGLKHTAGGTAVMNSTIGATRVLPNAGELAAVDETYTPTAAPSNTTRDNFFQVTGSNAIRQFADPTFTLSSNMQILKSTATFGEDDSTQSNDSETSTSDSSGTTDEGPPLKGPLTTITHIITR